MDAAWSAVASRLEGTFLDRQIQRTNRNLLITSLILVLAVVGYGAIRYRYFYNFFKGPFEVNAAWLDGVSSPDDPLHYFVRIHGESSEDTGVREVEHDAGTAVESGTTTARFSVLFMGKRQGKRLLIVKRDASEGGAVFQGELEDLPSDVRDYVITPLLKEYPSASQLFYPMMLETSGFRIEGFIAIPFCLAALVLAAWLIRREKSLRAVFSNHPVVKSASRYGAVDDVARQLDMELQGNTVKLGRATVTESWVLIPTTYGFSMCHIPDLIWAYKKVTRHYHNFIPTNRTFDVIMYDRHGVPLQMQTRQKHVDAMLNLLSQRSPWAVFGYSKDLNNVFTSNWGGFVATVQGRRAKAAPAG